MSAATSLLLVEDDEFVRSALTRALNRTGVFAVSPAVNGAQALEILAGGRGVDAILTDLQMPVMDGLTLLGHLLERGVRVPVAVMTGQHITADLGDRLRAYGIAATFSKPIEISLLVDELQRSLSPTSVGRIAGITLFGFLQLIEVERKTALIVVRSGGEEGRLYFDEGALVHGEMRAGRGLDAVYAIVSWPDPKLEIFYARTSRHRTITAPLQHVLMEAARRLDESARAALAPPAPAASDADPVAPAAPSAAVQAALEGALQMEGALGVALVDSVSGVTLGRAGTTAAMDFDVAGAGAAEVVRAQQRALAATGSEDAIEDIMVTLGRQYHLIRATGADQRVFLYLVLDRAHANLGMARRKLAALARRIAL